jgi:L-2-hydroxyglutarate oxidase LhgO
MDRVDTLVIGAGVVGLACARSLAKAGREVVIVERETAIGTGASARNSEVVHAGLYYATGSHKARLCVAGRQALYAFCAERGIAHRRCGKLIVAVDEAQLPALAALHTTAHANGVTDVQRLSAEQARALEPALHCVAALWSPSTGIVDSHGLMLALLADAEAHGAVLALDSEVQRLTALPSGGFEVEVGGDAAMTLQADRMVNAGGLFAPEIAARTQGLEAEHVPAPGWCKGSYFTLTGRSPFSRLVYPMHSGAWLGVHLTLDLQGQARFGPDAEWLPDDLDPRAIDYRIDPQRAAAFYGAIRRWWPGLPDGALQPAYAGVRPKVHRRHEPAPDFRIDGPSRHGLHGLVNLLGIESPGLTASLALGDDVAALLG